MSNVKLPLIKYEYFQLIAKEKTSHKSNYELIQRKGAKIECLALGMPLKKTAIQKSTAELVNISNRANSDRAIFNLGCHRIMNKK